MENKNGYLKITETPLESGEMQAHITIENATINFLARAIIRILECIEEESGIPKVVACGLVFDKLMESNENKEQENDE